MNPDTPIPDSQPSPGADAPPVVLVVDDSRVMRVALSRLLSKRYRVMEAEDGEQGWQVIQEHPEIELVFCDLSMPVVDGFEVLRRVRASEDKSVAGLPFVVITGHEDDEGMQRKAASMGASDFVSKPFRSAEITTRARTLVSQRRDMRRLREELDSHATVDGTTGLAEKAHFTEHLSRILSLALRHGLDSTCLVLAVDDYDGLAARLGADGREALVRDLAMQLQATTRAEDAIGYLGNGQFGVAMSGAGPHGARLLSQRLATRLDTASSPDRPAPKLLMGVSTPVTADTTLAAELLSAALADLKPLAAAPAARPAAVPDTATTDIESALSRVESVLSLSTQGSESAVLREELNQAREALDAAEQANASLNEQLNTLQEGARQQVAKAHQEMQKLRSQLNAVQAQFRDYMQENPRDARHQAETELAQLRAELAERDGQLNTELAQLRAVLAERDEQLEAEQTLRRQAQEMVAQLQTRLAELTSQNAAAEAAARGSLFSKLLKRG